MNGKKNSWKELIIEEMQKHNEYWESVVEHTFERGEENILFCTSWGLEEGEPFTLWTERRVYFPVCYDGSEWVGSVPRNPSAEVTRHIGG